MFEVLLLIPLMCGCVFGYWKTSAKRWLLLALGLFLLTSNVISVVTIELISIFVFPPYTFIDLALNLELAISATLIAAGLGLILKGMWDNHRARSQDCMHDRYLP